MIVQGCTALNKGERMTKPSYRPLLPVEATAELIEFCDTEGIMPNRFIAIAIKEAIARRTKKEQSVSSLGQSA